MRVDIEERTGPPISVDVPAKKPRSAIRRALEDNDGPGLATIRGHDLYGRKYADGHIEMGKRK